MNEVVLQATGLTKRFVEGRLDVTVLGRGPAGECGALRSPSIGTSGSGKTRCCTSCGRLDAPTSSAVTLRARTWPRCPPLTNKTQLRSQRLGFVYSFCCCPSSARWTAHAAVDRRMARPEAARIATEVFVA
jgi:lipoprotein-releasing system ATP-binding protein